MSEEVKVVMCEGNHGEPKFLHQAEIDFLKSLTGLKVKCFVWSARLKYSV